MPNDGPRRVEVITGVAGRRDWPTHETLRIVEESLAPGESVSMVARRNGVAQPPLLLELACGGRDLAFHRPSVERAVTHSAPWDTETGSEPASEFQNSDLPCTGSEPSADLRFPKRARRPSPQPSGRTPAFLPAPAIVSPEAECAKRAVPVVTLGKERLDGVPRGGTACFEQLPHDGLDLAVRMGPPLGHVVDSVLGGTHRPAIVDANVNRPASLENSRIYPILIPPRSERQPCRCAKRRGAVRSSFDPRRRCRCGAQDHG